MDINEIQTRVDGIVKAMLEKGMREPSAKFSIENHKDQNVYLWWKSGINRGILGDEKWKFFDGNALEVLDKAADFIFSQPNADEAKLNDFMAALGSVIDIGKKHGIDVDYLNPLTDTMKRLSENAITDQRAHEAEE